MKPTTTDTELKDYIVVQQLLGYDPIDRPSYKVKCITLPKRITRRPCYQCLTV